MDFSAPPRVKELLPELRAFMRERIFPLERKLGESFRALEPELKKVRDEVKSRGWWAPQLPKELGGMGLTLLEHGMVSEVLGASPLGHYSFNCQAPDAGNLEILHQFGSPEQKEKYLLPLARGELRSCFSMTEPELPGSNPTWLATEAKKDGDDYVINGHKWWTSGAADPRCAVFVVMGKTDPDADSYRQQSMVLVPRDAPGVTVVRDLPVFGYHDQHGHCEVRFDNVRVPVTNLLGQEGGGFAIAQARLGPGRIHHCMRAIGMAERALELMCRRAVSRVAFGKPIAHQGVVQQQIAESRMEIEQARMLVLKAAWLIDQVGAKGARTEIAAIKVIAPRVACAVIDRAIQVHGGGGVSDDFPLANMYAGARTLRIADGPDEVHMRSVARVELGRYVEAAR